MKNKTPFDDNFNPSPFDDLNKDDLNEMLKECDALNQEVKHALESLFNYLMFHKSQQKTKGKNEFIGKMSEWPLMFFCVKNDEKSIFTAMLSRDNKDMILSFAYDWLVEHNQMRVEILKDEFIRKFWNDNFENKLI